MKKGLIAFVAVAVLLALVPTGVRAEEPQPFQYALVKCSGLSLAQVVGGQQIFDTQYGFDHKLTAPEQWRGTFIARVNEFASSVGCPQVLRDDGTLSGALTFWYKIYVPTYQGILRYVPE